MTERTDTQTPAGDPVALVTVLLDAGPWIIARTDQAIVGDHVDLNQTEDGAIETAVRSSLPTRT